MKKDTQNKTSWGGVAEWYQELLGSEGTYQKELILPNLVRLLAPKQGEAVLDVACGPGFFAKSFNAAGARVTGVDVAKELVALAKKNVSGGEFLVASADKLPFDNAQFDKVALILAIQNIENAQGALNECARVVKPGGGVFMVMNHPAFRVPHESGWGWDDEKKIQYRRIDRYISESKAKIKMHPGDQPKEYTLTFHRPLQFYFKAIAKGGLCVSRLEEWTSHKKSQPGPRAAAENRARKEIPLFLFIEAKKLA